MFDANAEGRSSDEGVVAVWVALLAVVLFGIGAFAVDVASWYVEGERLQKAVDSAAMSGVVYLPADFTGADATAKDIADRNGWTIDGTETTYQASRVTGKPSQLQVTMSSEVNGTLGPVLGVTNVRVTRTAIADYTRPSQVGNSCNVYGNQAMETSDVVVDENCTDQGGYWLNIAGDNTNKARGDGYGSGWCTQDDGGGSIDRCHNINNSATDPGINSDHADKVGKKTFPGYIFKVRPTASGQPLRISGYDLGWVATGDHCTEGNLLGSTTDPRYGWGRTGDGTLAGTASGSGKDTPGHAFCTGDTQMSGVQGDGSTVPTRITIRRPSKNPWEPLGGAVYCQKTLPGWNTATLASALGSDAELTRTFHRWSHLCGSTGDVTEIPAAEIVAGEDWVIQIETGGAVGADCAYSGGREPCAGGGQNRYALRAELGVGGGNAVNLSAVDKFSIYVGEAGVDTSKFDIIRLDSSTEGRVVELQFFDVGDASEVSGYFIRPDGKEFTDCEFSGPLADSRAVDCYFKTSASKSGGYWVTIRAKIPAAQCSTDSDLTKCWARLKISTKNPSDTTTWTARVVGDPVRLVK